jgi:hypothetical protein
VLPGSFQSELGCSGDWIPDCNASRLTQTGPYTWEGTFLVPEGNWEYKVAYNNSWTENYGLSGVLNGPNIPLSLAATTLLRFSFSSVTHLVSVSPAAPPGGPSAVVLAGSFQSELGCAGDWQPDCHSSALTYDFDSNTWYGVFSIPQGNYEFKVAIDNSWNENYGLNGVFNGANIPLTVSSNKRILFRYNHQTHIVTTKLVDYSVILAGSFQSELGCAGDWQPDCPMSALSLDAPNNLWKQSLRLPAGNWEFKVAIDGSWIINYGDGGVQNGSNILLNLPEPSVVSFVYNPDTHIVSYTVKPDIVVLPGSFQSELGCGSDWDPACDKTRLSYDLQTNLWSRTFDVPVGNWEFKVALDHSWNENYGQYGVQGGQNIPLSVQTPSTIQFSYDPVSHYVYINYKKTGFCVTAFYDANGNGYKDWDENIMIDDASFSLSGNATTATTDQTGKSCYTNLPAGNYIVKLTNLPARYLASSGDSQTVYLFYPQTVYFGAVCLGGAGAQNLSFWMNSKGKAAFDGLMYWQKDYILSLLRYFSLVDANGKDFDPHSYDELATWMQQSNSQNMSYKLSTQLAALLLNSEVKNLGSRAIHTEGANLWGIPRDFMDLYTAAWWVNQQLMNANSSTGNDQARKVVEAMVKILDEANNDLSFVQLQPCNTKAVTSTQRKIENNDAIQTNNAMVWPNPSHSNFNVRPSTNNGNVEIRVMDVQGKLVFSAKGSASKVYSFGDRLYPGLYLIETIQAGKKTTMKVLKQ